MLCWQEQSINRKHMVSLRGSKFGSRVAMLCCNPSHATRPGPGTGLQIGRFNNFSDDRFPMTGPGGRFGRGGQWNPNYPPFRWPCENAVFIEIWRKGASSTSIRTESWLFQQYFHTGKKWSIVLPLIGFDFTVFFFIISLFSFVLSLASIHTLHCILRDGHLPYKLLLFYSSIREGGLFAETLVYPKDAQHYLSVMLFLCVMFSIRSLSISSSNLPSGSYSRTWFYYYLIE